METANEVISRDMAKALLEAIKREGIDPWKLTKDDRWVKALFLLGAGQLDTMDMIDIARKIDAGK